MSTQTQMQSEFVDGVKIVGKGVGFQRIRRITGYLVGTLDRFNNAKRAEVGDRVKHMGSIYRQAQSESKQGRSE